MGNVHGTVQAVEAQPGKSSSWSDLGQQLSSYKPSGTWTSAAANGQLDALYKLATPLRDRHAHLSAAVNQRNWAGQVWCQQQRHGRGQWVLGSPPADVRAVQEREAVHLYIT